MKSINLNEINLNDFRVLYYAAKELNYSKAAAILGVTQPTISTTIKKIESEYDCKLFESNKKTVKLTEEGKKVFYYVESLYESLNNNYNKLLNGEIIAEEVINIGIPTYLGTYFLPKIISKINNKQHTINIIDKSTTEMVRMLHEGSIDLLIDENINYYTNNNITIKNLMKVDACFAASNQYYIKQKENITIEELIEENLLLPSIGSNSRKALNNEIREFNDYKSKITVSNSEMLINLVKQKMGIGYFKRISILNDLYNRKMIELSIDFNLPKSSIQMAYNKHNIKGIVNNYITTISEYIDKLNVISKKTLRIELDKKQDSFEDILFTMATLNKFYEINKIHFVIKTCNINYDNFNKLIYNLYMLKVFIVITINEDDLPNIKSITKYLNRLNIYLNKKNRHTFDFERNKDIYIKIKYDITDDFNKDTNTINNLIIIANSENFDIKINFLYGKKKEINKYINYIEKLGYELSEKGFGRYVYFNGNNKIILSIDDCEACNNGIDCFNHNNLHLSQDGYLSICKVSCTTNDISKEIKSKNEYKLDKKIDTIIINMENSCFKRGKF